VADTDGQALTVTIAIVDVQPLTARDREPGVAVSGTLFDGPMWRQPAHSPGAPCIAPSRIVEPGLGSVRLVASADWNVPKPLPADGAITLATYGFSAQVVDALGQPTGTPTVQGCTITTSAELDALVAATAPGVQWGSNVPLPDYCFIGRNPGGLD